MLATKILQVMSLGIVFDNKEQFMKRFNPLVEENKERIDAFYATLLDRTKACEEIKPDAKVPSGVYKDSLLLLAFMMKNGREAENGESEEASNSISRPDEE